MVSPRIEPKHGITGYANDMTQGPVCAMACPAATLFRNYFAGAKPGKGQDKNQLDNAADIAKVVGNRKHNYWTMKNGYLLPVRPNSFRGLNERFERKEEVIVDGKSISLSEAISLHLRVGVHWNTETARQGKREPHRVCQVFSSAVPLSYTNMPSKDFKWLGAAILNGTYEATLAVGAILAAQRRQRVTVYWTCVGGGAFGNPHSWIAHAMLRSLDRWSHAPIDVKLVHFRRVEDEIYLGIKVPKKVVLAQASAIREDDEKKYSLQDKNTMVTEKKRSYSE